MDTALVHYYCERSCQVPGREEDVQDLYEGLLNLLTSSPFVPQTLLSASPALSLTLPVTMH